MKIYYNEESDRWVFDGEGNSRILLAEDSPIKFDGNGKSSTKLHLCNHIVVSCDKQFKIETAIQTLGFINTGSKSKVISAMIFILKIINKPDHRKFKFK